MLIIFLMSLIYKAKLTLGCHYYSDRADALTDDAFKRFFADNPAYQVTKKLNFVWLKDNPFKASGKKVTVKAKKIKKKAKTLGAGSVYKVTPSGTVLYAEKVSGYKKITVNKLNGNITVAKKTKKGTYKIKVKIMSTGNATYKASDWKTVTVTVKVK